MIVREAGVGQKLLHTTIENKVPRTPKGATEVVGAGEVIEIVAQRAGVRRQS